MHLFTEASKSLQKGKYYPAIFAFLPEDSNPLNISNILKEKFYEKYNMYPKVYAYLLMDLENPTLKVYVAHDDNFQEVSVGIIPGKEELYSRSKGLFPRSIRRNNSGQRRTVFAFQRAIRTLCNARKESCYRRAW